MRGEGSGTAPGEAEGGGDSSAGRGGGGGGEGEWSDRGERAEGSSVRVGSGGGRGEKDGRGDADGERVCRAETRRVTPAGDLPVLLALPLCCCCCPCPIGDASAAADSYCPMSLLMWLVCVGCECRDDAAEERTGGSSPRPALPSLDVRKGGSTRVAVDTRDTRPLMSPEC